MITIAHDWDDLRPGRSRNFESPLHTNILLSGLSKLKSKNLLLDVTLIADGEAFQAHKVVLASISDYFRAMFTDAMKESKQSEIYLNGITSLGMKVVLDYIYSSRLELTLDNIQHVLLASSHVQIEPVVQACSNYLLTQLDLDNCVDIATIAETYSLSKLRISVYRYMCLHLEQFSQSTEFFHLSLSQLEYLLSCDFPVDVSESTVLNITLQWMINHSTINKLSNSELQSICERLLHSIHLSNISYNTLINDILPKQHSFLAKYITAQFNLLKDSALNKNLSTSHPLINSRGMELAIVKVGGFSLTGISNEITYYLESEQKWKRLTSIPHVEQCNFGTTVHNNKLYVVGGCFNQSLQEIIHPFGFIYNPMTDKWTMMSPLQRERCRFTLNTVGSSLIAIGGDSEIDDEYDTFTTGLDCEIYNTDNDSWDPLASIRNRAMPTRHASTSYPQDNADMLFISGGLYREQAKDYLLRYEKEENRWTNLCTMLTPRADHVMVTIGNKLYACGGWYDDVDNMRVIVDTIDMYMVDMDVWFTVTTVPTPRLHAGIVAVGTKIYFIGGFLGDSIYDRGTSRIECFDTVTNVWSICENYPQEIWEHTCVTLYIPKCRDDMQVMST